MKNRLIKQFQGFLKTPPLWDHHFQELIQFNLPEPDNFSPTNLEKCLPSLAKNFVMGKRVERFFEWIIQQDSGYKLLAQNIQINRDNITQGELDFLIRDLINRQNIHVEMVYKFYLYDPSFNSEINRWIGPNRKDSLLQKTEKLKQKQFPLLFKAETKNLLNSLDINSEKIIQRTCFKANLFIPRQFRDKYFAYINNRCIAGIWLYFEDFNSTEYNGYQFYAPKKQDWPILPKDGETWFSHSEIISQIQSLFQKNRAPLIWVKKPGNIFERIFVVWW
ncbi:hypothetical protein DET49_10638 [Salegentibacter sp. 24]|uniref:DUF1853 family protein n=1 Tax=Salegentibacter sp. 24 TaxID=2183986 RepID=UPI00105CEBB7|nr:DUF1853 family protein [Salegentibacter sp. 24]TDN89293.1 hypothetical protein DET49_10638 [Salegentibacter sp. 24]